MGKIPKNFALLKRGTNPRISLRELQANSASSNDDDQQQIDENSAGLLTNALGNVIKGRKRSNAANRRGNELSSLSSTEDEQHTAVVALSSSSKTPVDTDWAPSRFAVFKILFSIRLSASLWSIISDCDEVYNYWEPLHLLLFGRGFQTWEYSPQFAIRSWLYILFYAIPGQILLPLVGHAKVAMFFALRFIIGFVTLLSELYLFSAVCHRFGNSVGRAFILFSIFSTAMFASSCAFLPSSFSMAMNAFAMASYLREQWFLAITFTALSALLGWPFAAILGLPIALEVFVIRPKQLALKFFIYSLIVGSILLVSLYTVDTHFFGKSVIAPLNIVLYNVFSRHGPNLYGVEPFSYYVKNLLLNFNIAFPMSLFALPFAGLLYLRCRNDEKRRKDGEMVQKNQGSLEGWPLKRWHNFRPFLFLSITMLIWMLIFFLQPHKEERFLFPVYPHICLLAAVYLDVLCRITVPILSGTSNIVSKHANKKKSSEGEKWSAIFCSAIIGTFVIVSLSRTAAVYRNYYGGLMDTYKSFNEHLILSSEELITEIKDRPIRLCVGKEWHRFPSSFFLPDEEMVVSSKISDSIETKRRRPRVEMNFLRSEFRGLLPAHFATGQLPNVTRKCVKGMNDQNQEEVDRYVPVESCDFVVDSEVPRPTEFEPDYSGMPIFKTILQRRVLLPAESHPLFRAFYIPFTDGYLKFATIHLLKRKASLS